ncbi:MAG: signal peptidase I [Alphaproteobacteria bacterium]|nr:signal peptidase I [Alphaproteobacteria bacterium]MBL0718220.1 signal peptidase I [Alphaproteobacteria bacterium]
MKEFFKKLSMRKRRNNETLTKKQKNLQSILGLMLAVFAALLFRSFLFEPFRIPSESMMPNLLIGDFLFVKKSEYGYTRFSFPLGSKTSWEGRLKPNNLKRGDMVVFRPLNNSVDHSDNYVKRVIAISGDTVDISGDMITVNQKLLHQEKKSDYYFIKIGRELDGFEMKNKYLNETIKVIKGKLFIDGKKISNNNFNITYLSRSQCDKLQSLFCLTVFKLDKIIETNDNVSYEILQLVDQDKSQYRLNFVVPENEFFVMGDNRNFSLDGRVFGTIPENRLVGKVVVLFFSHNYYRPIWKVWNWGTAIRWDRIFRLTDKIYD